jgi:hypothetical protein
MGALILGSGMEVGGWAPGNMVSGIRPPSPMRPRCACAALAAAIRVRARTVSLIVVMVYLMGVMALDDCDMVPAKAPTSLALRSDSWIARFRDGRGG